MESRAHAVHAGLLAIAILVVAPPPTHPLVLAGYVIVLGVGIDADHFLIARLNTGGWRNLRRIVRNPGLVVFEQTAIFDTLDVWAEDRLFSHLLLAGLGVGLWWILGLDYWAGVTAVTLYVHLLADTYADVRSRARTTVETADALAAERDVTG